MTELCTYSINKNDDPTKCRAALFERISKLQAEEQDRLVKIIQLQRATIQSQEIIIMRLETRLNLEFQNEK